MEWAVIIPLVIEAIMACLENRDRTEIIEGLANPGPRETLALWRVLRSQGFRGRKLYAALREGLQAMQSATRSELTSLVDAAEEARAAQ